MQAKTKTSQRRKRGAFIDKTVFEASQSLERYQISSKGILLKANSPKRYIKQHIHQSDC